MAEKTGKAKETLVLETADGREFVFQKPGRVHLKRWMDEITENRSTYEAQYHLLVSLAVNPGGAELKRIFEQEPGLVIALSGALLEAAGVNVAVRVKNLGNA